MSANESDTFKHENWRLPITAKVTSRDGRENIKVTLQPLGSTDLQEYHELHADPRVWQHYPSGRHTTLKQSQDELDARVNEWEQGISYWSVKIDKGVLIGVGGARLLDSDLCWNLYYRVAYEWWGYGIAAFLAGKGLQAAKSLRPDLPVVAYLLEHNIASRKIAEKNLGLTLQWRGHDAGNPDADAIRLVFSDRPFGQDVFKIVTQ